MYLDVWMSLVFFIEIPPLVNSLHYTIQLNELQEKSARAQREGSTGNMKGGISYLETIGNWIRRQELPSAEGSSEIVLPNGY